MVRSAFAHCLSALFQRSECHVAVFGHSGSLYSAQGHQLSGVNGKRRVFRLEYQCFPFRTSDTVCCRLFDADQNPYDCSTRGWRLSVQAFVIWAKRSSCCMR